MIVSFYKIFNCPIIHNVHLSLLQVVHFSIKFLYEIYGGNPGVRRVQLYDSYLKIGPNQKKMGLDSRARQALFALRTIMFFETLVLETPRY